MLKKLLLGVAIFGVATYSYAQGMVNFNTQTIGIKVYDVDKTTALAGTGYYAQLFAADGFNAAESSLTAKGNPVNFRSANNAGYVVTSSPAVPSVQVTDVLGGSVTLQMRAWSANFSSYSAAATAYAANDSSAKIGKSNLLNITSGGPGSNPPNLTGLQSFNLTASVPEPTTIALGVMGVGALLFRRRK